jgi:hypothetical protein
VHVPLGLSRRRPRAALDAVLGVIRANAVAGRLGAYEDVVELSLGREHYRAGGGGTLARGTTTVVTTYLQGVGLAEVEALSDACAAAHPWEHPVIEIVGPDGAFLWAAAQRA